jgi:hypothetical protein
VNRTILSKTMSQLTAEETDPRLASSSQIVSKEIARLSARIERGELAARSRMRQIDSTTAPIPQASVAAYKVNYV